MKKIIFVFFALLFLSSCGGRQAQSPDTLRAAVLCQKDSISGENTYKLLETSIIATLETDKIEVFSDADFSSYDILYIDKSAAENPSFDAAEIEEYVKNGGNVFLDNETYSLFTKDFIGAEDFADVEGCPVSMEYPYAEDKTITKIQGLVWDFSDLYKNYANFDDTLQYQYYGVGVIPSTAKCVTSYNGLGIYTLNEYGKGYVFFTNPILPNNFSVNSFSPENTGETPAPSAVGASKLMRDYFAEFVSLKKYGYAVENVFGSNARPAAAWSVQSRNIRENVNVRAERFEQLCEYYGQIASFNDRVYPSVDCNGDGETDLISGGAQAGIGAEYSILIPFYQNDNLLVMQPSNTPNGNGAYTYVSAKYASPLLFANNCDKIYRDYAAEEEKVRKADRVVIDYGYNFVQENQLAKMSAAALNTHVNAKWDNDTLYLSASARDTSVLLYDENYRNAVGVRVILPDGVIADNFNTDANVSYKKDNDIYVSLDKDVQISKNIDKNPINILSVNLPSEIKIDAREATVKFKDGAMMEVTVSGTMSADGGGWETTRRNGITTFRKYGAAETLKIVK